MTRKIFVGVFMMGLLVLLICGLIFFGLQRTRTPSGARPISPRPAWRRAAWNI